MMCQYKISIIVPVYNSAAYLPRCVKSILSQSYSNFELILVNDGSIDDSEKICQNYAKTDSRVKYIEQKNLGVAVARNKGLSVASGDYITFADSDDWLESNAFKTCIDAIDRYDADMIKFGYFIEGKTDNSDVCTIDKFRVFDSVNGLLEYTDKIEYHAFVWNMFFNKNVAKDIWFDENLNWLEDQIFGYRCFLNCKRIAYIPDILYHYQYWDSGSLSSVQSPRVVALASTIEHNLKTKLTNGSSYKNNIDDEYRWRLEFLIDLLYTSNRGFVEKRELAMTTMPLYPLKLREGRIYFNKFLPFWIRDLLLKLLFFIKRKKSSYHHYTRV